MANLNIYLPEKLKQEIIERAWKERKSTSQLACELLESSLRGKKAKTIKKSKQKPKDENSDMFDGIDFIE